MADSTLLNNKEYDKVAEMVIEDLAVKTILNASRTVSPACVSTCRIRK
jgi:hypothetical protein